MLEETFEKIREPVEWMKKWAARVGIVIAICGMAAFFYFTARLVGVF